MDDQGILMFHLIGTAVAAGIIIVALRINHAAFHRIHEKKNALQLHFLERLIATVIIIAGTILTISFWGGFNSMWKTFLGGTAIVSAVLAFAAQDVIKDVLAGLMIVFNKPFEIGNRIELEDGTVGIVKDITMRHVVILKLDTIYAVIPNSKLNAMSLINYSYLREDRSAKFDFYVAYDTDIPKAMDVIREAIISSEYSIAGKLTPDGYAYAPIYFMAFEESSLKLSTTVYYEAGTPSEVLISDINSRVNEALKKNDIEIPYNYINVIEHQNLG